MQLHAASASIFQLSLRSNDLLIMRRLPAVHWCLVRCAALAAARVWRARLVLVVAAIVVPRQVVHLGIQFFLCTCFGGHARARHPFHGTLSVSIVGVSAFEQWRLAVIVARVVSWPGLAPLTYSGQRW
jgi:hypothetical protein